MTVEPFFDFMGVPRQDLTVEVPGRDLSGSEFAAVFPITTDPSVLPAAGDKTPASGANFSNASVDPLFTPDPLPLLPPEELPNWQVHFETVPLQEVVLPLVEDEPPPNGLPSIGVNAAVRMDDEDLEHGILGSVDGSDDPGLTPLNAKGVLSHDFGSDGGGTVLLLGTGAPVGFAYVLNGAGTQLTIFQNGNPNAVLEVTLTNAIGGYEVEQLGPIAHTGVGENDVGFVINYRVTDGSGDSVDGVLSINVDDDTPMPLLEGDLSTGAVDEDGVFEGSKDNGLGDGIANGPGDLAVPNMDGDNDESTTSGNASALFLSGADVPLTYSLVDTPGAQAALNGLGLTSGGVALTYAVTGNVLTASTDNTFADPDAVVFTFTLNPTTGAWTFDLEDQLDHPSLDGLPGDNEENDLPIALGAIVLATDFDGDLVTANAGSLVVTVNDDTPIRSGPISSGTVDEDLLTGGIEGGNGDIDAGAGTVTTVATGSVTGPPQFQSGADEPLTFSVVTDTSALEEQNLDFWRRSAELFGVRQHADRVCRRGRWHGRCVGCRRPAGVHVHAESGRGVGVRSGGPARPCAGRG